MQETLPTLYQDFIHLSRYARWIDSEKRRETWAETVDRYIDFMCNKCKVSGRTRTQLRNAIINLEIMPSMRALMTAGPALERDNVAAYNCFSGSEPFYTMDGVTTLAEASGTTQNVLTREGTWEKAEVRSFGIQALQSVTFKPCTTPDAKTNVGHMVKVTPDHRWITSNRGEVTDLKVGDLVPFQGATGITVPPDGMPGLDYDLKAWIAGFGFGGGTIDSKGRAKVRLCGDKNKQWLPLFERYGHNCVMNPPSYNGDAVVLFRKGHFEDWKKLPSRNSGFSYLASWLEGYLAADGHKNEHQPGFSSQDDDAIRFVMDIAPLAGYLVTGRNISPIMETNLGTRKHPLQRLTLRKEGMFRVQSIEELGKDEVFCVTEPKTGTFTLRNGILTGNCSYLAIDHIQAFDEMLYILMCGSGVGFSAERQFIAKLPNVAPELRKSKSTIIVEDSKIGWANSFRELVSMLYQGRVPQWDVSELRPAGAKLKTFGGRASGPDPLEDLFRFTVEMFTNAAGRKLTSIECHDLCCKIGEVVVVGGVRRSALISLSNLSDDRMRKAKAGNWWETTPWRMLSNNSCCYTEKPSMDAFMREWLSLYESKSGERGIFNRVAAHNQVAKYGRRDPDHEWGCNPCITEDTWIMTDEGPRQVVELIGKPFTAIVEGRPYRCETGFFKTGEKTVHRMSSKEGYELDLTGNHKLLREDRFGDRDKALNKEWVELDGIDRGDVLFIANQRGNKAWGGSGSFDEGWLLGEMVGDGGFSYPANNNRLGYVRFRGDAKRHMVATALGKSDVVKHHSDLCVASNEIYQQITCVGIVELAERYGISPTKALGKELERTSSEFHRGFIRGFFDADGSIQGSQGKGVSVRLGQASMDRLKVVQRMLLRLGIASKIYPNRRAAGWYPMPDGHGDYKDVYCEATHEMVISGDNIITYRDVVGFEEPLKAARLDESIAAYKRNPNTESFTVTVESIREVGKMAVYDCTVDEVHEFDANGLRAHNCSEIILRPDQFCVGPDTPLVTSDAIHPRITDLEDKEVDIWNGKEWTPVTVRKTGENQKLVRVHISDGSYLDCTPDHRWSVKDRFHDEWSEVQAKDLMSFSKYAIQIEPADTTPSSLRGKDIPEAYTLGFAVGHGCVYRRSTLIDLCGPKDWDCPVSGTRQKPRLNHAGTATYVRCVADINYVIVSDFKGSADSWYKLGTWSRDSLLEFVAGLADADGSETGTGGIRIYIGEYQKGRALQLALVQNGIRCSVNLHQEEGTETNLGVRQTDSWYVQITECQDIPCHRLDTSGGHAPKFKGKYQVIRAVEDLDGLHNTYCFTEPKRHKAMFGNVLTYQCNLTEVVVRKGDSTQTLKRKVRLATILGTMQSTLTKFRYLRPTWTQNTEEERLLGVSLTGVMDHEILSGVNVNGELADMLHKLRLQAVKTNKEWAKKLGIPQSAAITCNKPSGCRPGNALTSTSAGLLTLDEILVQAQHPDDAEWAHITKMEAYQDDGVSPVVKTYRNGVSDVMKATLSYGLEIESTPNHQWFVSQRYEKGKLQKYTNVGDWMRMDELRPNDILGLDMRAYRNEIPHKFVLFEGELDVRCADIKFPKEMDDEIAWLFGYLWGDGAMSPLKYRLRFTDEHIENLNRVCQILHDKFGLEAQTRPASQDRNAFVVEIGSRALWEWLLANGIWKYGDDGLSDIPVAVRSSHWKHIISFFAGLIDSDGCAAKVGNNGYWNACISTAYEEFAKHIQAVSWATGICFARSHNTKGENKQETKFMWTLSLCASSDMESVKHLELVSGKMSACHSDTMFTRWICDNPSYGLIPGKVVSVDGVCKQCETFDIEVKYSHWYYAGGVKSHNTVSQLVDCASGIHSRHSPYYIRNVRADKKDPLAKLMIKLGFPHEDDVMKPEHNWVFSFPVKAPEGAITQEQLPALEQLRIWKTYQDHWCEHKPSCTVTIREDEWMAVGAWVYDHFDEVSGISFLPASGHVYKQAPYQGCTKEEYEKALANMPSDIDWSGLSEFEMDDSAVNHRELACSASGGCELVDLVKD